MNDGVIKFDLRWEKGVLPSLPPAGELLAARDELFRTGWIGVNGEGIGYGNASVRLGPGSFLVTGSQTGHLSRLEEGHLALVEDWSIASNRLSCRGEVAASSESLTHGAIYEADPEVGAVLHGHFAPIWKVDLHRVPTTPAEVEYGTPAMAKAIVDCWEKGGRRGEGLLAMAGHEDGLLVWGRDLREALALFHRWREGRIAEFRN